MNTSLRPLGGALMLGALLLIGTYAGARATVKLPVTTLPVSEPVTLTGAPGTGTDVVVHEHQGYLVFIGSQGALVVQPVVAAGASDLPVGASGQ